MNFSPFKNVSVLDHEGSKNVINYIVGIGSKLDHFAKIGSHLTLYIHWQFFELEKCKESFINCAMGPDHLLLS